MEKLLIGANDATSAVVKKREKKEKKTAENESHPSAGKEFTIICAKA